MSEKDDFPDFPELPEDSQVHKMNRRELFEQIIIAEDDTKILILKIVFDDLKMGNMITASKFFDMSPNGIRKIKETTKLDGKEFTRLIK